MVGRHCRTRGSHKDPRNSRSTLNAAVKLINSEIGYCSRQQLSLDQHDRGLQTLCKRKTVHSRETPTTVAVVSVSGFFPGTKFSSWISCRFDSRMHPQLLSRQLSRRSWRHFGNTPESMIIGLFLNILRLWPMGQHRPSRPRDALVRGSRHVLENFGNIPVPTCSVRSPAVFSLPRPC